MNVLDDDDQPEIENTPLKMIPTTFSCKICKKSEINEFTNSILPYIFMSFCDCCCCFYNCFFLPLVVVVVASKRSFEFKASIQSDITNKNLNMNTYSCLTLSVSVFHSNCHTINSPKSDCERKRQ